MVINPNRPTLSIRRPAEMNVGGVQSGLVANHRNIGLIRGPLS